MRISRKILLLVGAAMLSCGAVSGFGLYGVNRVKTDMVDIASNAVPALLLVSEMRSSYLSSIPLVYDRAIATDSDKGAQLEKQVAELQQRLLKRVSEYAERTTSEQEKQVVVEVKLGLASFMFKVNKLNSVAGMGEMQLAVDTIQSDLAPLHERLSAAFDRLVKINIDSANAIARTAEQAAARITAITIAAAAAGILAIGIFGFMLGRSITGPLGAMQRAISLTSANLDFTDTFTASSNDEVGITLRAYGELLSKLRSSFALIQASSARMAQITEEVDTASKEIAENSLAQSDASAGMASAVEELTVSISMVATQAHDASLHTQKSRDKADRGADVILSTVSGIQTISHSVREASSRIDDLRNDSESISSVANIIKEIADQTNLLALNAAIEAARAGEQGRGFAVVADEVRKLAERTSKSTQEISNLLSKMQESARLAVDTMACAVSEVDRGVDNARVAEQSIHEIREDSNAVVSVVGEISEAVREQSAASTSISQRIEQVAQMTERNTAAAASTSDAVHRMSVMSKEIVATLAAYKV